jgi:hypothetical protein
MAVVPLIAFSIKQPLAPSASCASRADLSRQGRLETMSAFGGKADIRSSSLDVRF